MKHRYIIVTIDTIAELLKDYCGQEDLPATAMPIKLMLKPTDQGKLAILFDSPDWSSDLPPLSVSFRLKRIYAASS